MRKRQKGYLYVAAALVLVFLFYGGMEGEQPVYASEMQEEIEHTDDEDNTIQDETDKEEDPDNEDKKEEAEKPEILISCRSESVEIEGRVYVREAPDLLLVVSAPAGIAKVEYQTGEGDYEPLIEYQEGDDLDERPKTCEIVLKETEAFAGRMMDLEEGYYCWSFQVMDALGECAGIRTEFLVDQTAPDPEIFVSYHSDGTNPQAEKDTGIRKLFSSFLDRLFGRENLYFTLYLRDGAGIEREGYVPSGIDLEDLVHQIRSADGHADITIDEVPKEAEPLHSFVSDGVLQEGYVRVSGRMCVSRSQENVRERLSIGRLRDRAGNVMEGTETEELTGTTVLYFDQICPVLSVDYEDGIVDEECKTIFYREDAVVRLTVMEETLGEFVDEDGRPVLPAVDIRMPEETGNVMEAWTASETGVCTELHFPAASEGSETTYSFAVTYQDGSGNLLETDETCLGNAVQGTYTSIPIVVDCQAPKLLSFSIEGKSEIRSDGLAVYEHLEGEDVFLAFEIDDHEAYWNPSRVRLLLKNSVTGKVAAEVNGQELTWRTDGRRHCAVYGFDGEEDMEVSGYQAVLSYEDRAGNLMTGSKELGGQVMNGSYESPIFFLDHQAPQFSVSYTAASRLVKREDADPSLDQFDVVPRAEYTAYYREDIQVHFEIQEECALPLYQGKKLTGLKDFVLTVTGENGMLYEPAVSWKQSGNLYKGTFVLHEEGQYEFSVSYQDLAGNPMVFNQEEESRAETKSKTYESVLLVLDRTAPVVRISYTDQKGLEQIADGVFERDGRSYFQEPVYLKLEISDQNLRCHEILSMLEQALVSELDRTLLSEHSVSRFCAGMDRRKKMSGTVVFYLPLSTEAAYDFSLCLEDLAGNRTTEAWERVTIDRTCPDVELAYSVDASGFLDAVRYKDIRYLFADSRMTITVSARDQVSGIQKICCTVCGEEENTQERTEILTPSVLGTGVYTIPISSADFQGSVMIEAWDWAGNSVSKSEACIVESAEKHRSTCRAWIETETKPGRTAGGVDYYSSDIHFRLVVEDLYSGLKNVSLRGGKTIETHKDYSKEGIVHQYSEGMILDAAGNNENEVLVRAEYRDNTGHEGELEQRYNIDITPPVLEIDYDQNAPANGDFYRQSRTAVIRVQERNFDPADVEFLITNSEGNMPQIGKWETSKEGDEMLHVCSVLFEEDGDYTFSVNVMDLAGNRAEYGQTDAFTIDKTPPIVTVSYDNNSNQQMYYKESRTAVIDLLEHNFDASLIQVAVETEPGGTAPVISDWSREGDHHRASVAFLADGVYQFGVTGMDQAGNEMEAYGVEQFVIDQTAPELTISGVEDHSANQGVVMPRIECTDRNYGEGRMEILLEGCLHGVMDLKGTRSRETGREAFWMEDFPYEPEADDLYRLTVWACDLAGNESAASVMFSVNRFGSVYTLDDQTELLAGSRGMYYTNTEPTLVVTETNADTLEFREITLSLNGELYRLEEGVDYSVQRSGNEEGWKQYVYTIPGQNFQREGIYALTIYSEDRAQNASDNHTKGKKIEFAVDKTAPSILLSGLEEGGRYRERSRAAVLDIQDNLMIAEAEVWINGIKMIYHASEIQAQNGRITLMAGSGNQWQSIRVTASDAAGNQQELEERKFLITSNLFVQFFMNKKLFYGSIAGLLFVWAGIWHALFSRRRLK